jgi:hypothetical protein
MGQLLRTAYEMAIIASNYGYFFRADCQLTTTLMEKVSAVWVCGINRAGKGLACRFADLITDVRQALSRPQRDSK